MEFAGAGRDSPRQRVMAVWCASNLKKSAPNGHYYLQRAVPKYSKGTLRPDFQVNTRHRFFFKANVTTRYRKTVVRKSIQVLLY